MNCNSSLIDTANSTLIPSNFTTDIAGNTRIIDGDGNGNSKPDLGAYEYSAYYNVSETICQGDTFAFGSMNLTSTGIYQNTLTTANGCDSIVNLTLNVLPADSGFVTANVCQGGSFTYNSQTYNQSGIYYQTTSNPGQCDSIIKISVNYFPVDTTVLVDSNIYNNQNFLFYGQNINASGTYYHSLNNINNCDSVIQQTFNYYIVDTIINDVFCSGSTYNFEGIVLNTAGTYYTTIQNSNNADSSIQLNLSVLPVDTTILDIVYLNTGSNYNFYGTNINSPGTYYHTASSQLGCDSILKLTVLTRRYVTVNGSGSKNGYNWANAYQASNLQTAINDISIAGGGQVWVAKGTYKRTNTNSRNLSFTIYNNVELFGGFGGNETDISQRTSFGFNQFNETRLSGDIGTLNDSTDNTYIIIRQHAGASYCLIDGLTIRDAMNPLYTGEGGGVYLRQGGILKNSVIYKNYAGYKGGGVYNDGGKIENCIIKENKTDAYGGGVLMREGEIIKSSLIDNITNNGGGGIEFESDNGLIDSCLFDGNYTYEYGWGGALSLASGVDTISILNSTFSNNTSILGGAIHASGNTSEITIDNCVFDGNQAIDYFAQATSTTYDGEGGAFIGSNANIINSTFLNNSATNGGALRLYVNNIIDNSEFYNNQATAGGAVYFYQNGEISNSKIHNNTATDGGGAYFYEGGLISNSEIYSNYSSNDGGGLFFDNGGEIKNSKIYDNDGDDGGGIYVLNDGLIQNCDIFYNRALYDGGGIYNYKNNNLILNSRIFNNYSRYHGGGIYQDISNSNKGLVVNADIFNNQARYDGGGVYFYFGGELINCNINNNKAEDEGGGVYINYKAKIKNSVIWGNDSLQIHQLGTSSFTEIDTTAIMNSYSGYGAGMIINLDSLNFGAAAVNYPIFINPTSFAGNSSTISDSIEIENSNWNLNCGSALIDAGNNNLIPDTISIDIEGNSRITDGNNNNSADIDLGAYEANYSYELDVILCENDTFFLGSQPLTQAGTYNSLLTSSNGCDSNLTVNISISPIDSMQLFETICSNQDFYFGNMTLNQSGIYNQTFTSQNGCDSVVELNLTVLPIDSSTIQQSICEGSNFVFNGTVYNQSGIYYDTLVSANSCDSIVKIELTVNQVDTVVQNETICEGNSYNFFGNYLTSSGIYYHSLTSSNLCDSVIELFLTVNNVDTTILNEDICLGGSYSFFGNNLNQSGVYFHTLTASTLCDSIIQLNLNIRNIDTTIISQSICEGSTYPFFGQNLDSSGIYFHNLTNQYLCDSIIKLDLTVNPIDTVSFYEEICEGSSYNFYGQNFTQSGNYYHSLISSNNCDSIIHLNLIVNSVDTTITNQHICNSTTYNFYGQNLTADGVYYHTLSSVISTCDSVIKLNLSFNTIDSNFIYQDICVGDSIFFNGQYLNQAGTYYHNSTNINNCDSITILNLSVQNHTSSQIYPVTCASYTSPSGNYVWTQSGIYSDTISNIAGCDSIISIDLVINNATYSSISDTNCYSYTSPSGNYIWTQSGVYTDTISNAAGCDSVITINLNILNHSTSTINPTVCESYTSPSGNYFWTQSGVYTDTISNAAGCDSVITINLIVNYSSISNIQENACRTYTSPSGNYMWTQSGSYVDTIQNALGCDSIININLIIHDIDTNLTYNSPVLTSNQSNAISYHWIDCNTLNPISGATSQTFTPTVNSSYAVIITTAYCLDTSECYNVTDVSITELQNFANIQIYPNPSFGEFNIKLDTKFDDLRIDLYSINGSLIKSDKYSNINLINYNLNQAAGVYWIQISNKNSIIGRFKLVKIK